MDKYLVTSALPYANGRLHIGHIAGAYLPADIYVRFLRLNNEDVVFVCGTDEHGAPISIRAESEHKTPQQVVDFYHENIKRSFDDLNILFDNFSGTSRPNHHKLAQEFFLNLLKDKKIHTKITKQSYCEYDHRFLPDRYVEGECPFCHASGARGDQCDACGKLIDALQLKNPKCMICGNTPVIKETMHWFLDLPAFERHLTEWLENKPNWKDNVVKFILSWIKEGLQERSITRDINWGVPVPLENAENKVLYVWFDAPIGYISSTIEWSEKINQPDRWKDYWLDRDTKLVHFIGKDNIPFHAIIWPALLMGQDKKYCLPWDIPANEYLTLEGEKISTSRNFAIWVDEFIKYFDGELLRYVLAANAPETKDSDFTWKDFQNAVNNSLANVLGNLANRVFSFAKKHFNGELNQPENKEYFSDTFPLLNTQISEIHTAFSEFKVRKAVKSIIDLARDGNRFFDEAKPWVSIKEDTKKAESDLYVCCDLLRIISITLYPVMPESMKKLRKMMNFSESFSWVDIENNPEKILIGDFQPLFKKVEDKEIEEQLAILKGE